MKKILIITLSFSSLFSQTNVVANGLNTMVDLKNSNYLVNGGIKKGENLFFSFEKLNLNSSESLSFSDIGIKNNISRITNETSFIDGVINSSAKNLYLLNSNGIVFGKNAQFNLNGSLHLSSADYLKFADENLFYTNSLKSSVLSSSSPTSFGFLGENFATIKVSGQGDIKGESAYLSEQSKKGLILKSGENLNIVAGEIILENGTFINQQIQQNGQKMYLEQNILIDKNGDEIAPENYGKIEGIPSKKYVLDNDGNKIPLIQRTPLSNLKVSEGNLNLIATNSSGEVNLNTLENNFNKYGNIKIDDFSISLAESIKGNEKANMNINILADDFMMDKGVISFATLKANSSQININANSIEVLNGSNLVGITLGDAKGANINLSAKEDIILSGENEKIKPPIVVPKSSSFISTLSQKNGKSGDIKMEAKNIILKDGAGIDATSFDRGDSGNLILKAKENIIVQGESKNGGVSFIQGGLLTNLENSGNSGKIYLEANNISFIDGARILASIRGDGIGGKVELNAKNSIILDGYESKAKEYFTSSLYGFNFDKKAYQYSSISMSNSDKTKGGELILNAPEIYILNGAFINTKNISNNTPNDLKIYTKNLILNKAGEIDSQSVSSGDAGNIDISTEKMILKNGSLITTEAKDGGGGDIKVESEKLLYLGNSKITTSVAGGDGNGGNVEIAKPTFSVLNSSLLFANAYNGDGGNINISARDFIESTNSKISASSKFGRDGEINIKAFEVDVSSALATLPTNFLDISKWKKTPCQKQNGFSSFIIEGRDGLPLMIDDFQSISIENKVE